MGFENATQGAQAAATSGGPPASERAARLEELLERRGRELRLPTTLEAAFRVHFLEEGLPRLRVGMVVGLLLFAVFAVWDVSSFPLEVLVPSLLLRFGLACPLMALVLVATWRPWSHRSLDLLRVAMCFGVGAAVVAITALANATGIHAMPHGLFLVTIAAYTVTGMRTPQAVVAGVGVLVMQIAADVVTGRTALMIDPLIFILSANVIGCAAALGHERSARTSFLRLKLLECRADLDGLTGIPNRRAFDRAAERAFQAAAREKNGVVIALVDVDHFKDYNDRLGHLAGDVCLRRIAGVIEELARRPLDLAARIGGEEFAVLWYDASSQGAHKLAARIRDAVEALAIERPDEACRHRVTVSVGAVHVVPKEAKPLDVMAVADEALYEAKRAGRDRVEVRCLGVE